MANMFNEMIAMPYSEMTTKYGKIFGGDIDNIYTSLSEGNATEAFEKMLNSSGLQGFLNTYANQSAEQRSETMSTLGYDANLFNMLNYAYSNQNEMFDSISEAIKSIDTTTNSDVESYATTNNELTDIEKMANRVSTWLEGTPMSWRNLFIISKSCILCYDRFICIKWIYLYYRII